MKIAISSSGKTLDSALDPRFGRCACFLIVDPEDMSFEAFDNQSAALTGGAGIQAAQFLSDQNVSAVITGHVGPNAVQALSAAGIPTGTPLRIGHPFPANGPFAAGLPSWMTRQADRSGL